MTFEGIFARQRSSGGATGLWGHLPSIQSLTAAPLPCPFQVDAVFFDAQNVGDMYKMRLALETRLPTSWMCTYAHVVNIRTGAQAVFVPGGCLATTTVGPCCSPSPAPPLCLPPTMRVLSVLDVTP